MATVAFGNDRAMSSPPGLLRPPRLRSGDAVAVIAPAGPPPFERLDAGIAILQSWGLEVRELPNVRSTDRPHEYLAAGDRQRAADFTAAWTAPDIRAVFCARGGYGAQRMLDLVDWAALRHAAPKVLAGYSDITALHQAVNAELGLVSLHGPMLSTSDLLDHPAAQEHLRATLFEPESVRVLTHPDAHELIAGTAQGVTTGGCVSVLAGSVGTTPPPSADAIVLLEDVSEDAYRVDGFLTTLRRSGYFERVAAVVTGSWANCEPIEPVLVDVLGGLGVPVLGDLGFGHGPAPLTVPLGVTATLDTASATLTLAAPALA